MTAMATTSTESPPPRQAHVKHRRVRRSIPLLGPRCASVLRTPTEPKGIDGGHGPYAAVHEGKGPETTAARPCRSSSSMHGSVPHPAEAARRLPHDRQREARSETAAAAVHRCRLLKARPRWFQLEEMIAKSCHGSSRQSKSRARPSSKRVSMANPRNGSHRGASCTRKRMDHAACRRTATKQRW